VQFETISLHQKGGGGFHWLN